MIKDLLKSILSFSLVFGLLLGGSIIASAEEGTSNAGCSLSSKTNVTVNGFLDRAKESSVVVSQSGNKVVEITDLEFLKRLETSVPGPKGKKLVGVSIAYTQAQESSLPGDRPVVTPQLGTGYYLKNITTSEARGTEIIRQSTFKGPSTATMSIKQGVSATWSSNTNISAETVSAALGFNVTKSYEVTDTYQIQVPAGKTYTIIARPYYKVYNFEVWYDPLIGWDSKVGYGYAAKPVGVCFYYYE